MTSCSPRCATVVKIGGGVLGDALRRRDTAAACGYMAVLEAVAGAARDRRVVVVPGGGPFADAVRNVNAILHVGDAPAHWMATLAMDQHAHLIASRLAGATLVTTAPAIASAIEEGRIPVLAPFQWLREADPLPHSWDVTSDSIAAWVAGQVGAARLVLVKPPGVRDDSSRHAHGVLVDAYFARALPPGVTSVIVPADDVWAIDSALRVPRP